MSSTVTSRCVRPLTFRKPSRRKWLVDPKGVATFLPLKSAGVLMLAAVRTVISSAGPILSTMPISVNGSPWLIPDAVAAEPVARPISQLPAVMAVLMSAPLPISTQEILPPAPCSNQPSPLAIIVGLVSVKKPRLTAAGAAARAPRAASVAAPRPARAARRVMACWNIVVSPSVGRSISGRPSGRRAVPAGPGICRSRSRPVRSSGCRRRHSRTAGTGRRP